MVHATQGQTPYRVDIVADGHALTADEPESNGGHGVGASPFDLVLAGLAACTQITLRMYAERKGWAGFDISTQLRHRMASGAHLIDRKVEVSGVPDAAGLERLRDIVERTPVTLALKPGFTISTVLDEAVAASGANP
jgi:putative redox protein